MKTRFSMLNPDSLIAKINSQRGQDHDWISLDRYETSEPWISSFLKKFTGKTVDLSERANIVEPAEGLLSGLGIDSDRKIGSIIVQKGYS